MDAQRPGFVFGDHTFLHPSENAPLSRLDAPKRQIRGAPPPTHLDGIARQATPKSPAAKGLLTGQFCGHGEPTMTIFDIVIDGAETVEVGAITDPDDPAIKRNLPMLLARKPGGDWKVIFRREWEDALATLEEARHAPLTAADRSNVTSCGLARVSIGFEYSADATSRDAVSWLTVDALFEGEEKPRCIVDAELA